MPTSLPTRCTRSDNPARSPVNGGVQREARRIGRHEHRHRPGRRRPRGTIGGGGTPRQREPAPFSAAGSGFSKPRWGAPGRRPAAAAGVMPAGARRAGPPAGRLPGAGQDSPAQAALSGAAATAPSNLASCCAAASNAASLTRVIWSGDANPSTAGHAGASAAYAWDCRVQESCRFVNFYQPVFLRPTSIRAILMAAICGCTPNWQ